MSDELREQLADIQHAIWAHWMGYMFGCGEFRKDDTWVMPAEKLERWWRQKEAPYSELSDKERESDRHQADKILAVVQPALAAANARAEAAEKDANELRAALAAERVRVAELEAHLAARQRRAELDAGGIGAVCPACGYELDEHGWCGMCTPEEV